VFTGIIEHTGTIQALDLSEDGGRVTIHAPTISPSLAVSNSVAVNGCCLTVVDLHNSRVSADLSGETIRMTSFGARGGGLKMGTRVNLEQPLTAGKELGGHLVLGHVDGVGTVEETTRVESTTRVRVALPGRELEPLLIPQGSVAVDGVSLTVAALGDRTFEVMLIPHTLAVTSLGRLAPGQAVNIEADVIGKYLVRSLALRGTT